VSHWEMDDAFLGHHKTRRAVRSGWEALGMWCALRTYVAKHLTDGYIPDEEIDQLPDAPRYPRKWLGCLVECGMRLKDGSRGPGLVDPCDGGWMLHDYLDHAISAEEIKRRKREAAARQKAWRDSKQTRIVTHNATHNDTSNKLETTHVTNAPPLPLPLLKEKREDISSHAEQSKKRADGPRPKDPMGDSMNRTAHWQRADVAQVFEAWKAAVGMIAAQRDHYSNPHTEPMAIAIDAYGIEDCLLVAAHCMRDGMVNGELDDHKKRHDTARYIFGNQETFTRILTEARKIQPINGQVRKSAAQQIREKLAREAR
jgi:hypothetical protein